MSDIALSVTQAACERGGRQLFAPVSFDLLAGQAMQIQGDNGAGKTSLLRGLCGLSPLSQGVVRWCGLSVDQARETFLSDVFFLGHALGLKDELSALENLQAAQAIAGRPVSTQQATEALSVQGLAGRMHLPLRVLSQGQKRRVALARLQVSAARLWLLDEPLVALDTPAQQALTALLQTHLTQGGILLFTSHQVLALADSVKVLRLQA